MNREYFGNLPKGPRNLRRSLAAPTEAAQYFLAHL